MSWCAKKLHESLSIELRVPKEGLFNKCQRECRDDPVGSGRREERAEATQIRAAQRHNINLQLLVGLSNTSSPNHYPALHCPFTCTVLASSLNCRRARVYPSNTITTVPEVSPWIFPLRPTGIPQPNLNGGLPPLPNQPTRRRKSTNTRLRNRESEPNS